MSDAFALFDSARQRTMGLHVIQSSDKPLNIRPASLRDPRSIPPRRWLYGTVVVRGYVTVVVAPGGVGKTSWSMAVAASVAQGKGIIGDHVHTQANVLVCNLEDPEDEFDRRLAACMIHHNLDNEDIGGRLFVLNGRERRLVMASLDIDGMTIVYPDKDAMMAKIRAENIGLVVVDPFVNSHELEENSNPHINAAARTWAEIADATGCGIILVHHTRKNATAGDIDSARGASALIGASRVALTITAMAPEEAAEFGIPEKDRRLHIRVDDGKANLSPPADKARWMRLVSINLGNGTPEYPKGDNVQAIEQWEPPSVWKSLSNEDCNAALDAIQDGPTPGSKYTSSRAGRGAQTRWAGRVLMNMFDLNDAQATKVIATWLRTGLIEEVDYFDQDQRKDRKGLAVNNAKRPSV
ncbi:hypothetical protein HMPREF9946_03115 [Acetobacteraceae bacterium AT-5844]|nr:hypothetical protein HMPREF9946_03115 [Acetobacteraceae bacterium AT-5844]